jgi:uncharacterized RDD family membrane protein YckC
VIETVTPKPYYQGMPCSINHSTLETKFCPVCGESVIQIKPTNVQPQWQQPSQGFAQPQYQPPSPQPQWQQPVPSSQGSFAAPLASRGKRFGGLCLDALFLGLSLILLAIPYLVWLLIVMKDGQTPGKQVLKMKVYGSMTNRPATWGHMAIRTILIPWTGSFVYLPYWFTAINDGYLTDPLYFVNGWYLFGTLITIAIFITDLVLFFSSPHNQRISDRWAKTVVLDVTPQWGQRY